MNRAYSNAGKTTREYAGRAINHLTPYANQGNQAYGQYADAIGVNGNDAQSGYWDNYQADPQRGYDEDRAIDGVNRSMSARGMSRSGFGALAGARAGMDAGRSYTTERLNRLQGLGQQGYSASNQLANIDLNTGNTLAGYDIGEGQNNQAAHMGLAGTRNMGWNSALKVGGMALSAATGMPVGMGSSGGTTMSSGHNVGMGPSGYGGDDTGPGGGYGSNFLRFRG